MTVGETESLHPLPSGQPQALVGGDTKESSSGFQPDSRQFFMDQDPTPWRENSPQQAGGSAPSAQAPTREARPGLLFADIFTPSHYGRDLFRF